MFHPYKKKKKNTAEQGEQNNSALTMKGKETLKGAPSADLLVCFPSRAHLALMPKPICSPARPPLETNMSHRRRHGHHRCQGQQTKRPSTRPGQASPLLWAKNKQMGPEMAEPTSPEVTCAGQIKVRPKAAAGAACKSWQSVMEEIERIHNSRNKVHKKRRAGWMESLGLKKEITQFLTCLRSIRFDLRCFGSFPESEAPSDDEVGEDNYDEYCQNNHVGGEGIDGKETSRTIFSKWFMVLQENQSNVFREERREKERYLVDAPPSAPPPNALLLMRSRSAPAKSWLQEKEEEEEEDHNEGEEKEDKEEEKGRGERIKKLRMLIEEERREQEEQREKTAKLAMMRYGTDLHKASSDIAKERWLSGGAREMLSRSISWKR